MVKKRHYFESQLISTVKAVEESKQRIVFVGHYRHGDGGSFPLLGAAIAIPLLYICRSGFSHPVVVAIAFVLLALSVAGFVYQKRIIFNLGTREIEIITRTLAGSKKQVHPVDDVELKAEKIHIRLAENCGALDLILPDQTVRLSVDGKFEWVIEKANRLRTNIGIPTKPC